VRDPALFQEAVQTLLQGDIDAGRAAILDYINATLGFEKLSAVLGRPQKNLMRMFGPDGNPTAENLLGVIGVLQAETGVHAQVRAAADSARARRNRDLSIRERTAVPTALKFAL